ncbi:hypothetical protein TNCV_3539561 [Trichonephila clavipes]|nr:hypothetical protein TNCV_3539561 [Trichonephila clavipes]
MATQLETSMNGWKKTMQPNFGLKIWICGSDYGNVGGMLRRLISVVAVDDYCSSWSSCLRPCPALRGATARHYTS